SSRVPDSDVVVPSVLDRSRAEPGEPLLSHNPSAVVKATRPPAGAPATRSFTSVSGASGTTSPVARDTRLTVDVNCGLGVSAATPAGSTSAHATASDPSRLCKQRTGVRVGKACKRPVKRIANVPRALGRAV